jgi:RNA polymerase sigma-70 factor (ECF subfamily)
MVEGQSPDGDRPPDWDQIVEQHAKRVFQVAVRILGSVQDAEDVSQDVFLEAFRLRQVDRVRTWTGLLVRLATLRSLDLLRRRKSSSQLRPDDKISTQGPFEAAAANELAAQLRAAIADLPDQQAAVFVLFHFEHLSRAEIAASLGVSAEAVSTTLYKARQHLLAELAAVKQGQQ